MARRLEEASILGASRKRLAPVAQDDKIVKGAGVSAEGK